MDHLKLMMSVHNRCVGSGGPHPPMSSTTTTTPATLSTSQNNHNNSVSTSTGVATTTGTGGGGLSSTASGGASHGWAALGGSDSHVLREDIATVAQRAITMAHTCSDLISPHIRNEVSDTNHGRTYIKI